MGQGGASSGGGNGGGTSPDYTPLFNQIIAELADIKTELIRLVEPGQRKGNTYYFTGATTTPTPLFPGIASKQVKAAIIQNLSTTDVLTVKATAGSPAPDTTTVAGQATELNVAGGAGQGGGVMVVSNVDLAGYTIITNINTGQKYSVYIEQ